MDKGQYTDDASIADTARLWRRIPPWHFIYDANLERWRPSFAVFDNDPDGGPMSILLEDVVITSGRDPASVPLPMDDAIRKAEVLIEAVSYIHTFAGSPLRADMILIIPGTKAC